MDTSLFATLLEHYQWQLSLLTGVGIVATILIGKQLLLLIPAIKEAQILNKQAADKKLQRKIYSDNQKRNRKWASLYLVVIFALILPFCLTLESQPWWMFLVDIFVILMVYDLFYYLAHRFLLHGVASLRRIHGIHHQARDPSWIDSHYVHPVEIAIGLWLFFGTVLGYALIAGPAHVVSIVVCFVTFHEINQLNHTQFKLTQFPFKTVHWIVAKHHVHHENMRKGNYATITLFYDYIFGTLD